MLSLELLRELGRDHAHALKASVAEFEVDGVAFRTNTTPAIMGVINLSPDSWYRESVCLNLEMAARRGRVIAAQGAAILDLGAESSLPDAERVSASAQLAKLSPLIRELAGCGAAISVETYDPIVLKGCFEAGARILNLTGNGKSREMYDIVRDYEGGVVICHVEGDNVREVGDFNLSSDPIPRMRDYFSREVELAVGSGVSRIFVDPGLGFYYKNLKDSAARVRHQMRTFLHSFRLRELGFPVCHALPHAFELFGEEVRSAEPFFAVFAALGKTDLFRTHEVPKTMAVLRTMGLFSGDSLRS